MSLTKPPRLQKGNTIGIISPASSPDDLSRIEKAVSYFEKKGYRCEVGKNVGKYFGYLAGTDEQRASDLNEMFANKNINAIICVRGGYGSPRILDKINYSVIKRNPKIFIGYSDITALQSAIFKKCKLITFAGPMAAVDFWNDVSPYTEEIFWQILTGRGKPGKIKFPENIVLTSSYKKKVEGKIIGGNLALMVSLIGTKYFPSLKDKILLLEEIGEKPYRVDRMLNQLRLAGAFNQISAVLLGAFTDCEEDDKDKKSLTLDFVIEDYLGARNFPLIKNLPHGHIKNNMTIPIGAKISVNPIKNYFEITEAVVS